MSKYGLGHTSTPIIVVKAKVEKCVVGNAKIGITKLVERGQS